MTRKCWPCWPCSTTLGWTPRLWNQIFHAFACPHNTAGIAGVHYTGSPVGGQQSDAIEGTRKHSQHFPLQRGATLGTEAVARWSSHRAGSVRRRFGDDRLVSETDLGIVTP